MTELEKVALIQAIAEEVADIVKGNSTSSANTILRRLWKYQEKNELNPPRG